MARRTLPRGPLFFKVLIKDYTFRLCLPPVYVEEYRKHLPVSAEIRSTSGAIWEVKLEGVSERNVCFTGHGWKEFVKDAKLQIGEFLVFSPNASKSRFDVRVYGTCCCEREISAAEGEGMEGSNERGYIHGSGATAGGVATKGNRQETGVASFFKIIINPEDCRLRIPKEFVRRHGFNLGDKVFLKVSAGSVWKVGLSFSDDQHWLDKGWMEFKQSFSIGLHYFLVFIQKGNSHFDVLIFDTSAKEIEYSVCVNNGEGKGVDLVSRMKETTASIMDRSRSKNHAR